MASTQIASTSTVPFTGRRKNSVRVSPRLSKAQHTTVCALPKQDNAPGAPGSGVQRALNSGAKIAVSLAAAQLALLPLSGAALAELAPQTNQNADFGPNEVSKKVIQETSVGAGNPFDQAAPGRSGGLFGKSGAGTNDAGAVDPSKVKEKGSEVINKVKSALPFQTLPLFEVADTGIEPYQTPPQENENADFGPNEVTKGSIGEISLDADNPFDTSIGPGRVGTTFGEKGPGSGDVGAVDPSEVKDNALKASEGASSLADKIKSVLPFQTLPLFELADQGIEPYQTPPQENENADFGPNEVTKDSIGDISLDANNPFDTSIGPGRVGTTFGEKGPGSNDTGAVDPSEVKDKALKASSIFDKLKGLLPFNTMQVFDLSVAPDTKNLGPNEVGKKELAQLPGADNKYDTATPGRAGEGVKNAAKGAKRSASEVIKEALAKAGN
ncbi:g2934 [Coccomyxa elongata]